MLQFDVLYLILFELMLFLCLVLIFMLRWQSVNALPLLSPQAEERRAAIRKIPEQAILGEVRRMVEEMQTLNKKLEETVSC